jgi:mRNA interferase YafQ
MREPINSGQFKKDYKLMTKRHKDMSKIRRAITILINGGMLPQEYKEHPLSGNWKGWFECHIEPNWLMIYDYDDSSVAFERTGTHSDLFE